VTARTEEKKKPAKQNEVLFSRGGTDAQGVRLVDTGITNKIILILVLLVAIKIIAEYLKSSGKKKHFEDDLKMQYEFAEQPGLVLMPYQAKPVLTRTEEILFHRLQEALQDFIVITQTQMSSFLDVGASGGDWQTAFNRISQKSVDFLVCTKDFNVVAAIELQDSTHLRPDRQRNDEFKRAALEAAGVRLIEYHARSLPSTEEIKEAFLPEKSIPKAHQPVFDYSGI
jgi:hypothetical protein